jgi:cytochrome c553
VRYRPPPKRLLPLAVSLGGRPKPQPTGLCALPAPALAGQSYEYLRAAMNGFANGERTNNLDMPAFMKALTESQRDAIAHYLAGL